MIEVKDLHFSYGGRPILQGVSFTVEQGECVAVLGNNGAGKSTLVTCINRILRPQSGTVLVDGEDLGTMSRNALARTVSYVPQKNELSHTTVYTYIYWGGSPISAGAPPRTTTMWWSMPWTPSGFGISGCAISTSSPAARSKR